MVSGRDVDDAAAMQLVAGLGAAMASANYPVTIVNATTESTSPPSSDPRPLLG